MTLHQLRDMVEEFVQATLTIPQNLLESEGYNWDEYPGVRMAHLHTALTLRGLAGEIVVARQKQGETITRTQYALLDHQRAFRDVQALLLGCDDEVFDRIPAPEEWPLRTIVVHMHDVERYFNASISNALRGDEPHEPTEAEAAEWADESEEVPFDLSPAETLANFVQLHTRVQAQLAELSDKEVMTPSWLWESEPRPILFRIQRWAAHLREHANQVEKTLHWLERSPSEVKMLARQIYAALAEIEGLALGAQRTVDALCAPVVEELAARYQTVEVALERIGRFAVAIEAGDTEAVRTLLEETPDIAWTPMADGLSPLLYSLYRGREEIVALLQKANPYPNFYESAATGNVERVTGYLERFPKTINNFTRDGYTALQLAAFFGQEEVVRLLLARGGDPHAVSRNAMRIQALHAATAARKPAIVAALVAAGADVNARQQDDFTPLMAAEKNGDAEIVAILKDAGAG